MRSAVVSLLLASLVLAAIFACPCPSMSADRHGCCDDETARIAPSDCCRTGASPAPWTPRVAPPTPVSPFAGVAVSVTAVAASPSPATSGLSFPSPPPRVLRI